MVSRPLSASTPARGNYKAKFLFTGRLDLLAWYQQASVRTAVALATPDSFTVVVLSAADLAGGVCLGCGTFHDEDHN